MPADNSTKSLSLAGDIVASRCHDITVSLDGKQVPDFDELHVIGMAVRLSLHLRGITAVPYDLLKQIALYLLHIPPTTLRTVVNVLAEIEFVKIDMQGETIRSIVPTIPYYDSLFSGMGEYAQTRRLSEPEELTLLMIDRLSRSPVNKELLYTFGAEKRLTDRMIDIASQGGYLLSHRARGKDIVVSPMYFPENGDKLSDLIAGSGNGAVAKMLSLISKNQGWPISLAIQTKQIGDTSLSQGDLAIISALVEGSITPCPGIKTTHHGHNNFVFFPLPGKARLSPIKRPIFEAAMALVAAVRQGQLLPAKYAIRYPLSILKALKHDKCLRASTEAFEQYRSLVTLRIGCLVHTSGNWYQFRLIDTPENLEAVDMAIRLFEGGDPPPTIDENVILAFHKGQEYIDSLVNRRMLEPENRIEMRPEDKQEIDNLLLRGTL